MGFARVAGAVVFGIEGHLVDVEAHIGPGLPEFRLVGLPDAAVRESRDRVRAAMRQCGISLPAGRITVNLAPARLRKLGSSLDLAIACAVMAAAGNFPARALSGRLFVGEIALDGSIRSVDGFIPLLVAAQRAGIGRAVVPREGSELARLVQGVAVWPVASLREVVRGLRQGSFPERRPDAQALWPPGDGPLPPGPDMADVRGQALARRALEIAAAGGHHVMLVGPPGSGKTMLAHRLISILPPLSEDEWLEVLQIYSAAGRLRASGGEVSRLWQYRIRPFRAPHHSCTLAGLVGGGSRLAPGELTLAHRGVLFLDEFSELSPEVVNALREPMEEGWVTLARGTQGARLPADVQVVGAANPCPCGYRHAEQEGQRCRCRPSELHRYRRRLEGPVADRFDLWVTTRPLRHQELVASPSGEPSERIRQRVQQARERQRQRLLGQSSGRRAAFSRPALNARMTPAEVRRFCQLPARVEEEMIELSRALQVSARATDSILKVARTLADLEGVDQIGCDHVREAFQFRRTADVGA